MASHLSQQEKTNLELLIDRTTLQDVLETLAEIAHEKAQHVESTWQDTALAQAWSNAAKKIEKAADSVEDTI